MAVTDEQWNKITTAINMLARSMGVDGPEGFETVLKEHWVMLHDDTALDDYVDTQELAEMEASASQQESDLADLKQKIKDKKDKK